MASGDSLAIAALKAMEEAELAEDEALLKFLDLRKRITSLFALLWMARPVSAHPEAPVLPAP